MTAFSIHNAVCPEADIMRHDAEVYARSAAGPMTDVSNLVCAGFRRWRRGIPRAIGRSADNQIDPGASPLRNIRRNVVETLRGNGSLEDAFVALVGERVSHQELSWLGNSPS